MTDKPTKSNWETLAAKESRGRDLTRETFEGIKLDNVYGPESAIDSAQRAKPQTSVQTSPVRDTARSPRGLRHGNCIINCFARESAGTGIGVP